MVSSFPPFVTAAYPLEIALLLKPGHYDLIYTKDAIDRDEYSFEHAAFGSYQYTDPPMGSQKATKESTIERFKDIVIRDIQQKYGIDIINQLGQLDYDSYKVDCE